MTFRALVVASLALAGCQRASPSSLQSADAGARPEPAAATAQAESPRYGVEDATLQRYIAFQDQTMALYAELLEELARQEATDGGRDGPRAVALFRKHAAAQDRIRDELGLSDRDVHELERIVGDVISRRAVAPPKEQLDSLVRMEELASQLPEDQRADFARTVAGLKARVGANDPLTDERRKYGDDNVNRVLAKEAVLTRQWNRAIATFAGMKPEKDPADAGTPPSGR